MIGTYELMMIVCGLFGIVGFISMEATNELIHGIYGLMGITAMFYSVIMIKLNNIEKAVKNDDENDI